MTRKVAWISTFVFTAAAGLAVAGSRQSTTVDLPDAVSWAGKTLRAGQYTFTWQGDPAHLDVKILNDQKKPVAEGPGHLQTAQRKYTADAVVTRQGPGTPVLTGIELGGRMSELVLGNPQS